MPTQFKDFEFSIDSPATFSIEEKIADYCGIEYINSSDLPIKIKEGTNNHFLYGKTGNVNCKISVYKDLNGNQYVIKVSNIMMTRKR